MVVSCRRKAFGLCVLSILSFDATQAAYASLACDKAGKNAAITLFKEDADIKAQQAQLQGALMRGQGADQLIKTWSDKSEAGKRQIEHDFEKSCSAGETVSIPSRYRYLIARYCDLGKSVVDNGGVTICVMRSGTESSAR